ncbi:DoxX family protein [Desmospora profundinema]|uniref:Membrane protein YphA (DoxX/SURF4 family) n=1 Tax=Desmospora profundinema TaxID=1571184 RepID=A0ABU1II28_9BACL|nr:DoxX family protein [Desmospora profundinema]MDR6224431.1 putative membrane protein YphA (DoxX/SURF4 family) [Desmospora profundinema]
MNKWWAYAGWIGIVVIALLFIQAGVLKLIGEQTTVEGFEQMGYPAWFRIAIGVLEITGAIALIIRASSRYGAVLLASIMVGAILSVLLKGQAGEGILPALFLCFLIWIAVVRKPTNRCKSKETMIS